MLGHDVAIKLMKLFAARDENEAPWALQCPCGCGAGITPEQRALVDGGNALVTATNAL